MRNIAKKVIHDHPKSFISMVLLIILSIITSLLPPLALEQIVNHLTDQKEVSPLFDLAYLGLIVLSDLFASAQNISITIFGKKLTPRHAECLSLKAEHHHDRLLNQSRERGNRLGLCQRRRHHQQPL